MIRRTRREFLKTTAAVTGALALGPLPATGDQTTGPPAGPAEPLALAIARWQADQAAEFSTVATRLTEQALAALGGMERFVSRGDLVWIKPNIGWNRGPELAANTNPDVVATLVRLCLAAGARKVKVGDNTCHPAPQTYQTSGIAAAARAAGAEVVFLDENRFQEVEVGGKRLKTWPVYPEILAADLLINVPVVKHHGLSRASLCLKNYMGVVGGDRGRWHQDLATCLCDITAFLKPRLCLLDAIRVLTAHGPQGGNPADVRPLRTVAAGTDIVALDGLGAELLGLQPARIDTLRAAAAAGLGRLDYRELPHTELTVS